MTHRRITRPDSVYEAALSRLNWVYDRFDHVASAWSGGKDSTVLMELACKVAAERGRLPLTVFWVDSEAQFSTTVELAKQVYLRDTVDFKWLRVPVTTKEPIVPWMDSLTMWQGGKQVVRMPDPVSELAEWLNQFKLDSATEDSMLHAAGFYALGSPTVGDVVVLDAERADEGTDRLESVTLGEGVDGITWGRSRIAGAWKVAPLYDWTTADIWKAIHQYGWDYDQIYDRMYKAGVPALYAA